ncbi:MAG: histidine kinase, partial [Flavobacteriales bacterium]|nr:histidine kinase [Flavobacteriales bacterium]
LNGGGLAKFKGIYFENLSAKKGLAGNYIYALHADTLLKRIYISTNNNGLHFQDSSGLQHIDLKVSLKIRCMVSAGKDLFLGTDGQGIFKYNLEYDTLINESERLGIKGRWIKSIQLDKNQNIWAATADAGIVNIVLNADQARNFGPADGLASHRIQDIAIDHENVVWYLTRSNGLGSISKDSITSFNTGISGANNISFDSRNTIWVSTVGNGVFRFDQNNFINYEVRNGLSSNNIYQLLIDSSDNIWVGTERGLDKLSVSNSGEVKDIGHFGYKEGFTGIETTRAACEGWNGNLWFGSIDGLMIYTKTERSASQTPPPIVSISSILKNYEELDKNNLLKKRLNFSDDVSHVGFKIKTIDLSGSEEVFVKYRLLGLSDKWSERSSSREIHFTNLPPGSYTFQLIARTAGSRWKSMGDEIRFKINAPFWQGISFIITCLCVVILLITLIIRSRVKRLYAKIQQREDKLRLQQEALHLEQKALRLQMNPHFIFNCLNSVQSLIVKEDKKQARFYLSKFSNLMRQVLDHSMNEKISLEEEIQTLENYLKLEEMTRKSFDFSINVSPEGVDTSEVYLAPMIVQPFIENAIIHGINTLSERRGTLQVSFEIAEDFLFCIIRDNGVGRKKAMEKKSQIEHQHKSAALIISQKRLSKNIDGNEGIKIIDLVDASDQPVGTEVHLTIPIESKVTAV